ncbi:3-phosphoshikimate 1-carboxyvinyltransferase [Lutimonas zeaxanthinifaciens]|uniref:3-phosphoshikimate 1-carboxyvinyltransferase n=1 Tax=Lutimonas zeaxanthinifaciens TaxID=3060215 RepID=UPI00265D24E9|nr:3-phosphoshikimate 1-carboxyvinyltransferase [Lutimonas sp. YSD2104]WKK66327.1 3-phosphoshikimate 1-carboxyvinyltransferase [Lutimonas sp. YSD2104]
MIRKIAHYTGEIKGEINISGSKSESNRLLILQRIFPNLSLKNVSNSDDTKYLGKALDGKKDVVDISHAGTAMRFLTAYFASHEGYDLVLTGSERMQNRPISILVDALRSMGADISYAKKEGYPPLKISGKNLEIKKVSIQGNVSSQYISALLLMAPGLKNGLEIELQGKVTSVPYIKMTLALLEEIGVEFSWNDNLIHIKAKPSIEDKELTVESDWSSASYFFSLVALSENGGVKLTSYKEDSLQGDSSLVEIYKHFGVSAHFENDELILEKESMQPKPLVLDLGDSPDLAQTIAVTCFGAGIACDLTGLHTLKIKETDRLVALEQELTKLGAEIQVTDKSLHLKPRKTLNKDVLIETYDDHRMAMAFAPLALLVPIRINDADVVTKSYTDFWSDFDKVLNQ